MAERRVLWRLTRGAMDAAVDLNGMLAEAASLRRAGRFTEAADAYERVLARWPVLPESWYNLAWLQHRLGRYEAALASYERALDLGAKDPQEVRLNRGVIFADHLHRPDAAEAEYRAAIAIAPGYWPAHFNLGNLHEDRGDRAAAQAAYKRVLELEPKAWEALARLANVSSIAGAEDPIVSRLQAALERADVSDEDKASLAFALGRVLDSVGANDRAFAAYARANRFSQKAMEAAGGRRYDRAENEALVSRIIDAFPAPAAGAPRGHAPIFICGMFRSGSTLTEQILAGHPRVTPGGELDLIPTLARTRVAPFPEAVKALNERGAHELALAYSEAIRRSFPEADLVTDKRPDNFLYIGLIKRLFPDAKIVHTRRNPLDNILSLYFLHLDQSMSYALDLSDAAHHYRQYRRLMSHWRALYPDDIFDFDYDAFVKEPRRTVERLLGFLGLDWSEDCLAFHRRDNPVKTASVWQVREPLYQRSSGRWRHYASQLETVRREIADLMEA